VRLFSVESATDLRRLDTVSGEAGRRVDCVVRCNTAEAGGALGMRMTGTASQFGMDTGAARTLPEIARGLPHVRLRGLHFFSATNIEHEATLLDELAGNVRTAAELADDGLPVDILDIGGGFAAPYARPGVRPSYPGLRDGLSAVLDRWFADPRRGVPRVAVETGRFLTADCGTLVTSVLDVKSSHGQRYAVLDAGINHLGGLSGLGRVRPRYAEPLPASAADTDERVHLAGPLCTAADIVGRDVALPRVAAGDLVVIPNVGAYGLTASLVAFLGHPAPVEVVLDGDRVVSASRMVLRREHAPRAAARPTGSRA
jgi:diaminopimelate decarboxylase